MFKSKLFPWRGKSSKKTGNDTENSSEIVEAMVHDMHQQVKKEEAQLNADQDIEVNKGVNIFLNEGRPYNFTPKDVPPNRAINCKRFYWNFQTPDKTSVNSDFSLEEESIPSRRNLEFIQLKHIQSKCSSLEAANDNLKYSIGRIQQENQNLLSRIRMLEKYNETLKHDNSIYLASSVENTSLEKDKDKLKGTLSDLKGQVDKHLESHYKMQEEYERIKRDRRDLEKDKITYELNVISSKNELTDMSRKLQHLETLKEDYNKKRIYIRRLQETAGNIRVFLKIRPFMLENSTSCLEYPSDDKVLIKIKNESSFSNVPAYSAKTFQFNYIQHSNSSVEDMYSEIANIVNLVTSGYNVSFISYGMTGTGKTQTILGDYDSPGLISFAFTDILRTVEGASFKSFKLKLSFLEIYKNKIHCTLTKKALSIQDDSKNITVKGQKELVVSSIQEMHEALRTAQNARNTGETYWNKKASLSHFFVILKVSSCNSHYECKSRGMLIFGDLAGFEKVNTTDNSKGSSSLSSDANSVNKSLVTLGLVIDSIRRKSKNIPFRDSLLTKFLKPCFTGDAITSLLLTLSEDESLAYSTMKTLQLGDSATQIAVGSPKCHIETESCFK